MSPSAATALTGFATAQRQAAQIGISQVQQFNRIGHQVQQNQGTLGVLLARSRQLTQLQAEHRALLKEQAAQKRHSARIEVRANLMRLTPAQAQESLQVLFAMDPDNATRRRLGRNNDGAFTHLVTWSGQRRPLSALLQRPQGYTLQDLSAFLARQGVAVADPAHLENAVFMALDIVEPRQG